VCDDNYYKEAVMLPKQGACSVLSRESFVGISLAKLPVSTSIGMVGRSTSAEITERRRYEFQPKKS